MTSTRRAGVWLLLTAALTAAMVATRVAADVDQESMAETLRAIPDSLALFSVSGVARLLSGVTLLLAGLCLLPTGPVLTRWREAPAALLLGLSGVVTAISGAAALVIALHPSLDAFAAAGASAEPGTLLEASFHVRWIAGKVGFSMAGIALVLAARRRWEFVGWPNAPTVLSAVLGAAMLFIWWDSATAVHRLVGILFFVWMVAAGVTLVTGRFVPRSQSSSGEEQAAE